MIVLSNNKLSDIYHKYKLRTYTRTKKADKDYKKVLHNGYIMDVSYVKLIYFIAIGGTVKIMLLTTVKCVIQ